MDGIVWGPSYATHGIFMGEYKIGMHQRFKRAIDRVLRSVQSGIDFHFTVRMHPQPNAVFSSVLRFLGEQARGLLDAQTPLFNKING